MPRDFRFTESRVAPTPDEIVSFIVVCRPQSGNNVDGFLDKLELNTLDECLPEASTLASVANQLKSLGFDVLIQDTSPDVPARGTVERFELVFKTVLDKWIRTVTEGQFSYQQEWFVLRDGAPEPSVDAISGALFVTLPPAPLFSGPLIPPITAGFSLRVPGDIALLTHASATHRQVTPGGAQATGGGIGVAVIDTGFYPHPYFAAHGYRITRVAVPGGTDPAVDERRHGTSVLANLLACAPDIQVFAIKPYDVMETAVDLARTYPINVISASWGFDLYNETSLPRDFSTLKSRILLAVRAGITFVAAGGNGGMDFPAILPNVVAVGGVTVDESDGLSVWDGASSFRHPTIYPFRNVPDLCGIADPILLPYPPCATSPLGCWKVRSGTSFAAPQVAGVCAVLVQKNPALRPAAIRAVLGGNGVDISSGSTVHRPPKMPRKQAVPNPDDATGGGLVDALKAWRRV